MQRSGRRSVWRRGLTLRRIRITAPPASPSVLVTGGIAAHPSLKARLELTAAPACLAAPDACLAAVEAAPAATPAAVLPGGDGGFCVPLLAPSAFMAASGAPTGG